MNAIDGKLFVEYKPSEEEIAVLELFRNRTMLVDDGGVYSTLQEEYVHADPKAVDKLVGLGFLREGFHETMYDEYNVIRRTSLTLTFLRRMKHTQKKIEVD